MLLVGCGAAAAAGMRDDAGGEGGEVGVVDAQEAGEGPQGTGHRWQPLPAALRRHPGEHKAGEGGQVEAHILLLPRLATRVVPSLHRALKIHGPFAPPPLFPPLSTVMNCLNLSFYRWNLWFNWSSFRI